MKRKIIYISLMIAILITGFGGFLLGDYLINNPIVNPYQIEISNRYQDYVTDMHPIDAFALNNKIYSLSVDQSGRYTMQCFDEENNYFTFTLLEQYLSIKGFRLFPSANPTELYLYGTEYNGSSTQGVIYQYSITSLLTNDSTPTRRHSFDDVTIIGYSYGIYGQKNGKAWIGVLNEEMEIIDEYFIENEFYILDLQMYYLDWSFAVMKLGNIQNIDQYGGEDAERFVDMSIGVYDFVEGTIEEKEAITASSAYNVPLRDTGYSVLGKERLYSYRYNYRFEPSFHVESISVSDTLIRYSSDRFNNKIQNVEIQLPWADEFYEQVYAYQSLGGIYISHREVKGIFYALIVWNVLNKQQRILVEMTEEQYRNGFLCIAAQTEDNSLLRYFLFTGAGIVDMEFNLYN